MGLENEVEYISQLQTFIEAEVDYHRQALSTLQSLLETLNDKRNEAASRPRSEHIPRRVGSVRRSESPTSFDGNHDTLDFGGSSSGFGGSSSGFGNNGGGFGNNNGAAGFGLDKTPSPNYHPAPEMKKKPMVKALYDFVAENEGELGFNEGDEIDLINQVDENWFEGSLHGQVGFFPINYVEVVNPL